MLHASHICQNIHPTIFLCGELHHPTAILTPGQISHKWYAAQRMSSLRQQRLVDIHHDNLCFLLAQGLSHGVADAAGRTSDNGNLIL